LLWFASTIENMLMLLHEYLKLCLILRLLHRFVEGRGHDNLSKSNFYSYFIFKWQKFNRKGERANR